MKKYESPLCETILLEEKEIISTSIEPPFIDGDDLFEDGL